ncbi:MAG: Cysteine desulfurase [Verrucomicrobiales bacterium]|nr:Cysteine desulfurase [Verrucomicrobiales bacterium]
MIYFDHNATAPMLPSARDAWLDAADRFIGNPSSPHRIGSRAEAAINEARQNLAQHLGCDPLDLVWTSGATESNNMVLHHCRQTLDTGTEIWMSAIEHPCVLETAYRYFPKTVRLIPVAKSGAIDLDWLSDHLGRGLPGLVAVMAANNETGVLQPWETILQMCHQAGVPFFCDAVQWLGRLPAKGLGSCDFLSGGAHKFGGPKGVGFLKCPSRGMLTPLLLGGKQEGRRRAGTENVPGIISLSKALDYREEQLARNENQVLTTAKAEFEQTLLSVLPGTEIVGASTERLWNTVSVLMPEADCQQRWVVKLDKLGFAVSTGSACSSGQETPSHVLSAMGYGAKETSRVLRFSSGWETPAEQWQDLLEALKTIQASLAIPPLT